ncbi:MAG: tetratricopeptide repeat protein [Nitrospirae bacterium]|nr:tetratricopeptide repeat protein [Nitrospirota bacterium]MBF0520408.1 tetratricopeptide repeat protein [Nitrospirota bacterium]MBF0534824.1 tetratricopeptide repeat protein [Nitrospirota bacterium]MBF0616498.1 tetratricopeptide repeat protein [Nitrospirota bacterium]
MSVVTFEIQPETEINPADLYDGLLPEHVEAFEELTMLIKANKSFQLIIVEFNDINYRDFMIEKLKLFDERTTVFKPKITKHSFVAFEDYLEQASKEFKIINMVDHEKWLIATNPDWYIRGFEIHRENIGNVCKASLLLWMVKEDVKGFAVNAPNMWSWRSGVFTFNIKEPNLQTKIDESVSDFKQMPLYENSEYDKALYHYNKSLKIAEELGDRVGVADSLKQIGIIYHRRSDYEKALEHYNQSLRICEELENKSGIATNLHQIGMVYQNKREYDKALDHYYMSLRLNTELGNEVDKTKTTNAIDSINELKKKSGQGG